MEPRTYVWPGKTPARRVQNVDRNKLNSAYDGLHMASHTAALSITAFAYVYSRRNTQNQIYSFGTGEVNALGGFFGAILGGSEGEHGHLHAHEHSHHHDHNLRSANLLGLP